MEPSSTKPSAPDGGVCAKLPEQIYLGRSSNPRDEHGAARQVWEATDGMNVA